MRNSKLVPLSGLVGKPKEMAGSYNEHIFNVLNITDKA
jgi:hypothetical protein